MSTMTSWTDLNLGEHGRSLVEASAGTGKTWTIGVLYLRLLLERGLTPRQIIVSTFTNAAAAELRERLRGRLVWAMRLTEAPVFADVPPEAMDVRWLMARWQDRPDVRSADLNRLRIALAEFDRAPVTTLHALCARILAEHPFASGALFRGRVPVDAKHLVGALADDLWRKVWQSGPDDALVEALRQSGVKRSDLNKYLGALIQPDVEVPRFDEAAFHRAFDFLGDRKAWIASVRNLTERPDVFEKAKSMVKQWGRVLDALESPVDHLAGAIRYAEILERAPSMEGIKAKAKDLPEVRQLAELGPRIAKALTELDPRLVEDAENEPLAKALVLAQDWARMRIREQLETSNQTTFDDIVGSVREALSGTEARALADALFEAWPVALVDEFQDTDPAQFAVLDAIYRNSEGDLRGRLIMIGDPKQAIYRFRGGDIHAYERAKQDVPENDRLVLMVNRRSSPRYVAAVNRLYGRIGPTLGPEGSLTPISYVDVEASDRRVGKPLEDAHGREIQRPLVIHALGEDEPSRNQALLACASQIAQMLASGEHRIGSRALQPSDIAVLIPGHADLRKLAAMLKRRGVPSVLRGSNQNVFQSPAAKELCLILGAAVSPQDPAVLRAALGTRIWGLDLEAIDGLRRDPSRWNALAAAFHRLGALLRARGPQAVIDSVLEQAAGRLLDTVEGERTVTDLRHLGELLQEAFDTLEGPQSLMAWFSREMDEASQSQLADAESAAMRLESDAKRVQLLTLHASKGLEFPVVFLPLMWAHDAFPAKSAQLHVNTQSRRRELVLDSASRKSAVQAEEREERYRILYVALTRAEYATHVFLCRPSAGLSQGVPVNERAAKLFGEEEASSDFHDYVEIRPGWDTPTGARYVDAEGRAPIGKARPMPLPLRGALPMRHSFTTLSKGHGPSMGEESASADDEAVTEDELTLAPDGGSGAVLAEASRTPHEELDALWTVSGAEFGNAVHAIFENRAAGRPLAEQTKLIERSLAEYGVRLKKESSAEFMKRLTQRLQATLDARLGEADGPRLADLAAEDMCAELEFNYVLDNVSLRELRKAAVAIGDPDLIPARGMALAGLMNGKIDLVFRHGQAFHLLDYKGNKVASGERACLENFTQEALARYMDSCSYRFQALLYAVALERYLKERLGSTYRRDLHLGDCWYLFVRATGLVLPDGRPCGVWRHRFPDELLDVAQRALTVPLDRGVA